MKLTHFITVALCCIALALTSSCSKPKKASNKITTEIPASVVTAIEAHDAIVVKYTQTRGSATVNVVCRKEYVQNYDIRVDGTKLIAALKPGASIPTSGIEVNVSSPLIEEIKAENAAIVSLGKEAEFDNNLKITVSSAACVKCKKLTCANLTLSATQASQIQLPRLVCNDITARATQCAAIYLDGQAQEVKLTAGTCSTINTGKITARSLSTTSIDESALLKPHPKPAAPKPEVKAQPDSTKRTN